jgi:hypothetical protein
MANIDIAAHNEEINKLILKCLNEELILSDELNEEKDDAKKEFIIQKLNACFDEQHRLESKKIQR